MTDYIHGYTKKETRRLSDQAATLSHLIHCDSLFPEGSSILEIGCGTGSQTLIVGSMNPLCRFTSIDISEQSIKIAKKRTEEAGLNNITFINTDINTPDLLTGTFDHALFCFVLEHLVDPVSVIQRVFQMVKPGGTITAIEGDHGSACFYPETEKAMKTINCQVMLQQKAGGDANIGRRLYPLLESAGLKNVSVSPRIVYADNSRPDLVEGFTKKTFIAMIEGVKENAISHGLISEEDWDEGIRDLYLSSGSSGTFSYTFYKGIGVVP